MQLTAQESQHYQRHLTLPQIGVKGQIKLKQAKVLVIGAGGLGCPILQYITAAGVGTIGIVDFDVVDQSNLQRQVLFNINDLGQSKAVVAQQKLSLLNPNINITAYNTRLTSSNCEQIFSQYDIVVDGSDNFSTRYLVNDACFFFNKPLVFGSISQFEGQVSLFNHKSKINYRDLFPEPPSEESIPNCAEGGVLGVLPGIIGCLQANEIIKMITGIGDLLDGDLLLVDALNLNFTQLTLAKNVSNPLDGDSPKIHNLKDTIINCGVIDVLEIDFASYNSQKQNFDLLDVRQLEEFNDYNIGGNLIPLNELENRLNEVKTNKPIVVCCKSGVRSKAAVKILAKNGIEAYNLTNGIPL